MKTVVEKNPLFEALSAEEAANVNGAWGGYYYYPCYSPSYYGGGYGGYGGGYGGSYSGSSSVTQTTNVNVLIED